MTIPSLIDLRGTERADAAATPSDPRRRLTLHRLRKPIGIIALICLAVAAVGQTLGTVAAGQVAAGPTGWHVTLLGLCVIGAALLDTLGRFWWSGVVDRAEGALRQDVLHAALQQPVAALGEVAVGEILDRVDDDTHELGTLIRQQVWGLLRALFGCIPMWIVAGLTWWPAWILFPVFAALATGMVRPLLSKIGRLKVVEEAAWTDNAAALEEAIAGRDDLRTNSGQAFAIRRLSRLSAIVHARFKAVVDVERMVGLRAGMLLHGLLAAVGVVGVALASDGRLSVARLVTLFLITTLFVGQIDMTVRHLPDVQAGIGALVRVRQMLGSAPEPAGGLDVPAGPLDLRFDGLEFAYPQGSFALQDIDLAVPAGQTMALVGRTGSGKSTLASFLSRAVDPPPGTVLLGGVDVCELDLTRLRAAVGVVTQRTEILAGTVLENITLFAGIPRARVQDAVRRLGLDGWVGGLPNGLDTLLGPGGTSLSAGEEQLIAFARLLVRDAQVIVLDEATARMDPLTERLVILASDRLLRGRTGILVAHRLSTIARADQVAVLDAGRLIQSGPRRRLAAEPGPLRDLLEAAAGEDEAADTPHPSGRVGGRRRAGTPPRRPEVGDGPSLAAGIWRVLRTRPSWGALSIGLFLGSGLTGALGALTGWAWGRVVVDVQQGRPLLVPSLLLVGSLLIAPLLLAEAIGRYPRWWVEVLLRTRMSVLVAQIRTRRLPPTPAGEVVGRALDADRYAQYADRWVDFLSGMAVAAVTAAAAGTLLAGAVLILVMVAAALASALGRPVAGRSAAKSSTARAVFGRALVSTLDSARTVKLAGRTTQAQAHLREVDGGRVEAAVFEHRVQAILDGVPIVMVQCGVVLAWAAYLLDVWGLATALLVSTAVNGFDWFGRVAGSVVTEAPGVRAWQRATSRLAGGTDLMELPDGVDLVTGAAPPPDPPRRVPLQSLVLRDYTAVHDDGTIGVQGVDLSIRRGELVLLVGQVGSGKSSLLSSLAGLLSHTGSLTWNGAEVSDPQGFLRPAQVAHVAQVPRVLSGTFADNVRLDHDREVAGPLADARMEQDVAAAGGPDALVGHRGVRLSGGQVQRLALARALAGDVELLLADDVSSALDASTEVELWAALRRRGGTVVGATSKRAALALADRVVVLQDGRVVASGAWGRLAGQWGHLAG